jgi:hypothetical protein
MKIQKMSLTNLQGKLTRTEMKSINGGHGLATCGYTGYCMGYEGAPTGAYDPDNTALANVQQGLADTWCSTHTCCTGADCMGATA